MEEHVMERRYIYYLSLKTYYAFNKLLNVYLFSGYLHVFPKYPPVAQTAIRPADKAAGQSSSGHPPQTPVPAPPPLQAQPAWY